MTSFEKELLGSRGFSLIPPDRLSAIISANPRLLLPSKSMLAYARKQSRSAIFEWSKHKKDASATRPILFDEPEFEAKPEPISIYHPMAKEISSSMGTPMEGFFDGADVVFEAAAPATPAAASRVSTEAPIPSTEPVPIDEVTHTKRDSETAHIPTETLTPQERAIPPIVAQIEVASLATPFVISTSDPFATLSQTVKDGSSLVVTPSSISSSATRGPDADLSSEGSEDVLEDPDDEPTMKKRVSNSNEEESANHKAEFMETFEEPRVAADTEMPTATSPATPVTPVSVMFSTPVSAVSTVSVSAVPTVSVSATLPAPIPAISTNPILMGPSPLPTAPSQFEVGSSSATVLDPMSEAAAFFARFDQPEVNDLDPVDFWGSGPPYVDFHGFRVPEDCASHLKAVYSSHGDFMQGFRLGRSAREHFLKLLGSVMNDIEHNFVDTVSTKRILQWRAAVQELVSVGFAVEFILDHLREIARAFFMRKVQPAVDAIDTRIEALRKEVADLEGRRERLLSSIDGSNHFGDQPLISRLR
ncbi:flocculation protein FLO11-like [Quercus robur]|uniref:flocculation protein FLO11-like n=1 Tax=Quercus robur TaxID=38942 RepID=UPI002163DACE|nr:flocculation protein FLO11-like [Quercus robur]